MRMIDDKSAFIKEIQRFLIAVTPKGEALLWESGVYDENTKEALRLFKSKNGMSADTVVDYETFEVLYAKYKDSFAEERIVLRRGDRGDGVLELNMLLKRVGSDYSEFTDYPHSEYFSRDTERAVIYMKERFGMYSDGTADGVFVERLKKEYSLISTVEENL